MLMLIIVRSRIENSWVNLKCVGKLSVDCLIIDTICGVIIGLNFLEKGHMNINMPVESIQRVTSNDV